MNIRSILRIEWISLIYLGLFVLAMVSPSFITRDYFGIDGEKIEEFLIFLFGIVSLLAFSSYQRYLERKEKEHETAKGEYERAKRELVESYEYIGSINRQIEVLKRLSNQTSLKVAETDRLNKDLLSPLLANAASTIGAKRAFIRYVELDRLRTEYEIMHSLENNEPFRLPNKELKHIHESGVASAFVKLEDGQEILVVPSDHKGKAIRAFLLLEAKPSDMEAIDVSLLKVFANQAELLHYALVKQAKALSAASPMQLVEQAEKSALGDIS